MNTFKKYIQYFPHFLVSIFLVHCLVFGATTADAIIVIALASLSGYKQFLSSKEQPNYTQEFRKEIEELRIQINSLKTEMGQISFNTRRVSNEKIRF